jgi:hypothetical protein
LLEADAQGRKYALQYGSNTDQHHQDFQEINEPAIANEFFNGPKANGANDTDDQDVYQDQKHWNLPGDRKASLSRLAQQLRSLPAICVGGSPPVHM